MTFLEMVAVHFHDMDSGRGVRENGEYRIGTSRRRALSTHGRFFANTGSASSLCLAPLTSQNRCHMRVGVGVMSVCKNMTRMQWW
jgi:hypothetical protein